MKNKQGKLSVKVSFWCLGFKGGMFGVSVSKFSVVYCFLLQKFKDVSIGRDRVCTNIPCAIDESASETKSWRVISLFSI